LVTTLNSAQDSDVIAFLTTRERQESAKSHISAVLEEYNVHAVDTLIGDITPPESLMKTLTDRKIAQQETTYETQKSNSKTDS
jgi:regulator of protease activity HflC (stomatin/prohibitin superfamily)